ncbi:MAG: Rne/Rng family ribonuclease [Actinomycetota bacterium]|nr:Rne/Rng family ribonuclease [Actinomycetota bacterium]
MSVLLWFRRKKRAANEAPAEAAPPAQLEEDPTEPSAAPPGAQAAPPDASEKRPRRRGTRGGRGRKKSEETVAQAAEPKNEEAKPKRRRSRTSSRAAARLALDGVKKEILVSTYVGEQQVAVLEDGKPAEVYLERRGRRSIAGNIYKGTVDNVLPGMEASFVDIGLEKNGFLYVDEIVVPELEGRRHGRRIQELLERGQGILVQATKDPMGTKGARLTTELSLPGRFLVYVPFGEGIGISRRLDEAERERLKGISKELELPTGGIIVRTAAEGASKEELEGDLALLRTLWSTIQGRANRTEAPALIYQEAELALRTVRDLFIRDFDRVLVDHERTYRRIVGYLKRTSKELAERVELYRGKQPLMEKHGVEEAIRSTLGRRVDLPSGGYLIFDYAEAFTVVDVNTGRFVGGRGKANAGRLEDTVTKNNLEAVQEVVRQLRLRDIGGIIVIDFVDMANPKNRALVEEALKRELERDRTKTYVVEISPLGLVEMTRQNVTDGPREILTRACPTCAGHGVVVSDETHAVEAERRLRALIASSRSQAFRVELNARVAAILIGPGASRLDELESETGRRFFFETSDDFAPDHLAVVAKGPVSRLERKALPVASGEEVEVTLEAADAHESGAAIARLDGYVVSVADAGDRVGQSVKVRVARATGTLAYAVLADGDAVEPPIEAGTELETEEEAGEAPPAPSGDAPESPRKRRTRRGTRGGRGRKKKPAVDEAPEAAESVVAEPAPDEEPAVEAAGSETPAEGDEVTEDGEGVASDPKPTERKRTRRGTRGGRRRRKRSPDTVLAAGGASDAEVSSSDGTSTAGAPSNDAEPVSGDAESAAAASSNDAEPLTTDGARSAGAASIDAEPVRPDAASAPEAPVAAAEREG